MSTFKLQRGEPLLDISSFAKRGPGRTDRLTPTEIEHIARTVRRDPEVMVKVSGGGASPKAVATHFKYIDRHGRLELETDDGERLMGMSAEKDLLEDWNLDVDAAEAKSPYSGRPGRKPGKLVHNIILSMPVGTPPQGLLNASRAFSREQFALKHRYAMVLHTDQNHPHVHLVVKALSHLGERLNIRKATLREWRQEFARHLREQGLAANATERAVRGSYRAHKSDGAYRTMRRGESTNLRSRLEGIGAQLSKYANEVDPGRARVLATRRQVDRGWQSVRGQLKKQGEHELSAQAGRFTRTFPPLRTENEQLAMKVAGPIHLRHIERGDAVR